jgi:tyrosine-protein phosphatase YwqE
MFFRPKGQLPLTTDIHSHLIPGVDDGVRTIEESLQIIGGFRALGYRRLITTPHISESYYPNSVDTLQSAFGDLKKHIASTYPDMIVELGAEYMVDGLLQETLKKDEDLLTWDGHILIETSFHMLPWITDEMIFELQSRGLTVVLAHPERYPYFYTDQSALHAMKDRGVKMQLTLGSLIGQYGDKPMKMAKHLLKSGMVNFLGSDVHYESQLDYLKKGLRSSDAVRMKVDSFENHHIN